MNCFQKVSTHLFIFLINFLSIFSTETILQKSKYRITLPEEWVEFEKNDNNRRLLQIDINRIEWPSISSKALNFINKYFDQNDATLIERSRFNFPCIFIEIKDTGRIPYFDLLKKNEYYQSSNIFWVYEYLTTNKTERLNSLSGNIPTETGLITITGISKDSDFEVKYKAIFHKIISSIEVSPNIQYKRRWYENSLINIVFSFYGIAGTIVFLIIIAIFIKRKNNYMPSKKAERILKNRRWAKNSKKKTN